MLRHMSNPTFEMVQRASSAELSNIPYGHMRAAQKARALTSSLHFALDQGAAPASAERVASVCESALVLCREIDRSLGARSGHRASRPTSPTSAVLTGRRPAPMSCCCASTTSPTAPTACLTVMTC